MGLFADFKLGLAGTLDLAGELVGADTHYAADEIAYQTAEAAYIQTDPANAADAAATAINLYSTADEIAQGKDAEHQVVNQAAADTAAQVGSGLITAIKTAAWIIGGAAVVYALATVSKFIPRGSK